MTDFGPLIVRMDDRGHILLGGPVEYEFSGTMEILPDDELAFTKDKEIKSFMTDFGSQADEILSRGASTWTSAEARLIEGLMNEFGKDKVQAALVEARGGEKPQIIEQQEVVD